MAKRAAAKPPLVVPVKPKRGKGFPEFEPDDNQRNLVTLAKGCGMTDPQICSLILNPQTGKAISQPTLHKAFEAELEHGEARVMARIAGTLVGVASDKTHKGCVTAGIFYLKSRAKWREPEPMWMENKRIEAQALADVEGEEIEVTLILEEPKEPIRQ